MLSDRELDALVAVHIFVIKNAIVVCPDCGSTDLREHWLAGTDTCTKCNLNLNFQKKYVVPDYYTNNIQDAWLVVNYMQGHKWNFSIEYNDDGISIWTACFSMKEIRYSSDDFDNPCDSAPRSVCLAALKAHGVQV